MAPHESWGPGAHCTACRQHSRYDICFFPAHAPLPVCKLLIPRSIFALASRNKTERITLCLFVSDLFQLTLCFRLEFLPGGSIGLSYCPDAGLVSTSSWLCSRFLLLGSSACLTESISQPALLLMFPRRRRDRLNPVSFRDFLKDGLAF